MVAGPCAWELFKLPASSVDMTHVTIEMNKPALYTKNKQTNVKHITIPAEPPHAD